jgi:nucleolar complex protein 2
MAKQAKRAKKFSKNKLGQAIKDRREKQKHSAQILRSKNKKLQQGKQAPSQDDIEDEADAQGSDVDDEDDVQASTSNHTAKGRMSVEEFMGGGFGDEEDDEDDISDEDEEDESLESIEGMSEDGDDAHVQDLAKLAERDPEFFKYLQENDKELLDFGREEANEDEEGSEEEDISTGNTDHAQQVTVDLLRRWQKQMLQSHSLRAFRRLLLAFRAAAHMGAIDEDVNLAYVVNDPRVFNKLIVTALKYVPVVLQHHIAHKQMANGKYKLPTNSKKYAVLQKSVQSFFMSLHRLLRALPEPKLLYACLDESLKMIPYLLPHRRMAREHLRILLELWSTSQEDVRIAAFLGIRKMATAGDSVVVDLCLRGVYRGIVRSAKSTTIYSIANINLMKNSASELYTIDLDASYQQAFGFIRQLAIHLRACLKTKTQESYQAVYNWQYVHCLDFWAMVLGTTCDKDRQEDGKGKGKTMQPLIYPLVQAATGAVGLIPTSKYFPLRFHVIQTMLRLMQRTGTYVPVAPYILEMLESSEFTHKAKPSTLAPLNFDVLIRTPKTYLRTRVYCEQLTDEATYFLLEFLQTMARSIAFPELAIPIVVALKRAIKTAKSLRDQHQVKIIGTLRKTVEKIERHADYIRSQRDGIEFAPRDQTKVKRFLSSVDSELPIESAARLARKVRKDKQALLQNTDVQVNDEEEQISDSDLAGQDEEDDDDMDED